MVLLYVWEAPGVRLGVVWFFMREWLGVPVGLVGSPGGTHGAIDPRFEERRQVTVLLSLIITLRAKAARMGAMALAVP